MQMKSGEYAFRKEKKRLKKEENGEYDFGEEKKLMKKKVEYTFRRRKKKD